MQKKEISLIVDKDRYWWKNQEGELKFVKLGALLKDLLYCDPKIIQDQYSQLIERIRLDRESDDVGEPLTYKEIDSGHIEDWHEASYLGSVIYWNQAEDDRAAIEAAELLQQVFAVDVFNSARECFDKNDFDDYMPMYLSQSDYTKIFEELLLNKTFNRGSEFCKALLNRRFSVVIDFEQLGMDIYFISSLDELVGLEIRNLIRQKGASKYARCKTCGRLFLREGKGSYKIEKCDYQYEIPCKNKKIEFEKFWDTFLSKVQKYQYRNLKPGSISLTDSAITLKKELKEKGIYDEKIEKIMEYWYKKYIKDKVLLELEELLDNEFKEE